MNVGEVLRKIRREKDMTMDEVFGRCGIHTSNLSEIENGKQKPNFDTLLKLATAYNVTFIINPGEDKLKYFDAFADISEVIQSTKYEDELIEWMKSPENEMYLRLARIIQESGINSYAALTVYNEVCKKKRNT